MPKFSDKDRGYARVVKMLAKGATPAKIDVGILDAEQHNDSDLTVVEIGTFHEFGLGVPERSFLRAYVDTYTDKIQDRLKVETVKAVEGEQTYHQALERTALYVQTGIQARISEGIPPELAESTIKAKGSSIPLIDTGQIRSSISYRVTEDA